MTGWLFKNKSITMHDNMNVKFTKIYCCCNWQTRAVFNNKTRKTDSGTWRHNLNDGDQPVTENKTLFSLEEYTSSGDGWASLLIIRQKPVFNSGPAAGILSENYLDLTAKNWCTSWRWQWQRPSNSGNYNYPDTPSTRRMRLKKGPP